jgi:flavin reductase (DIM6/NTAB) family NADH-FMN oxidoreductase RutF
MARDKVDQPSENWDRLFANVGQLAMITTIDAAGKINAATFATCVRCVHIPVQIAFTADLTRHTYQNILNTGEFVVNLAAFERDLLEKACVLGLTFAPGVNELEKANLSSIPSRRVKPPRIQECHRHFECELVWTKEWLGRAMIVGNVVAASVDADCVDERGFVVWDRVKPVQYAGSPYQRYVDEKPYKHVFLGAYETMSVETTYYGPESRHHDTIVESGEHWK